MVPSARDAPLLDSEYVVAACTAFGFGTELRGWQNLHAGERLLSQDRYDSSGSEADLAIIQTRPPGNRAVLAVSRVCASGWRLAECGSWVIPAHLPMPTMPCADRSLPTGTVTFLFTDIEVARGCGRRIKRRCRSRSRATMRSCAMPSKRTMGISSRPPAMVLSLHWPSQRMRSRHVSPRSAR